VAVLVVCVAAAAYRLRSRPRIYHAEAVLETADRDIASTTDPRIAVGANVIIRVSAEATDPQTAARSANALAEDYVEQDALERRRAEEAAVRSLEARLAEVDADRATLKRDAGKTPETIAALKRRLEINDRVHDAILSRIQQAAIASAVAGSNIRWVARALDLAAPQMAKATGTPNLSLLPSGPGADGIFNRLYSARVKGIAWPLS
jgi:hypothetical protein